MDELNEQAFKPADAVPVPVPVEDAWIAEVEPTSTDDSKVTWKLAGILTVAALVGSLLVVPFVRDLMLQTSMANIPRSALPLVLVLSVVIELFLSILAIAAGLGLGQQVGLGAPCLRRWLEGDADAIRRIVRSVGLAIGVGVGLGILVVLSSLPLENMMPKEAANIVAPSPWIGFLASLGAGIREEIWLRLGFMGFLTWLAAKVTAQTSPSPTTVWGANILAALLFGLIHIPQAASILGLNAAVIAFVMIGNGVPGVAFGWLYWRRGLIAAMVAHFMLDVVLKVIVPMLSFLK
jgi:hypothetical protein